MPQTSLDPLPLTRKVLRLLIGLSYLFGILILGLLVASIVAAAWVSRALGVPAGPAGAGMTTDMRMIMVLGIASVPLTIIVLKKLLAIVDTVAQGDPFVIENAARLTRIAWGVLGLELLHLVVGIVAARPFANGASIDIDWSFSITRWLSVLLLFVLARVFEHGARMREDLEGTV